MDVRTQSPVVNRQTKRKKVPGSRGDSARTIKPGYNLLFVSVTIISIVVGITNAYADNDPNAQPPKAALSASSGPASASDPNIAKVQLELSKLKSQVDSNKKELEDRIRDIRFDLEKQLWPIYCTATIFLIVGVGSLAALYKWAGSKTRNMIENAMYRVDPTYQRVCVPNETIKQHLRWLGLKDLKIYDHLHPRECTAGCVVLDVDCDDKAKTFRKFLAEEKPDPSQVGYILFTGPYRVPPEIMSDLNNFPNLTCSNSIATLGHAVWTIARVLVCSKSRKKE